MKLLYVIASLSVGGAEKQVLILSEYYNSKGVDVKIVSLMGINLMKPIGENIEVVSLGLTRSLKTVFPTFMNLIKIVKRFNPDVVHSHMFHANILCRLLRIFINFPKLICTSHSVNEGGVFRMLLYRITNKLCDVFTNVSLEGVENFIRLKAVDSLGMLFVPNAIDVESFEPSKSIRNNLRRDMGIGIDTEVLLAVGSLRKPKDYPNLLKSFNSLILDLKDRDIVLWILGDGPLREEIIDLSRNLKLENRIKFLGIKNNVSDYLNACDIFVMSSSWEGVPLALLEAMSMKKPVVVTNCGGIGSLLKDYRFIVSIENSFLLKNSLKDILSLSLIDRNLIGESLRNKVLNKNSIKYVGLIWKEIYGFKF